MSRPLINFERQINIGHVLLALSTLSAGTPAYIDLRRDVTEHERVRPSTEPGSRL